MYVCTICASSPWAIYSMCMCKCIAIFYQESNSGKKGSLALEWIQTGSDPLTDHCLHHRASGALAALDLDLKLGSYIVHYSE